MCHEVDCYFCLSTIKNQGCRRNVKYAKVASVTKPVPRSTAVPYPVCPKNKSILTLSSESIRSDASGEPMEGPKVYDQSALNDLMRDLDLGKESSEILASRLQERNLLASNVKVTCYRDRHFRFSQYYAKKNDVCFCHNITGLFVEFGVKYDPNEWRLFIDSSKLSLKAVLLHHGNNKPSVPVAHAVNMKETYESMVMLLDLINYNNHEWNICADLKVVSMITGLQQGYTKYCCFLCKWDSRAREQHYVKKNWPKRINYTIGENNLKFSPLVKKNKIILPPLHIKLGLFKNFVKALRKDGDSFHYLKSVFPNLSDAKIKEGIFVGPQIKKLYNDSIFISKLTSDEVKAWNSFRSVVDGFLGNKKSENYEEIVEDLLTNYKKIGMCLI